MVVLHIDSKQKYSFKYRYEIAYVFNTTLSAFFIANILEENLEIK